MSRKKRKAATRKPRKAARLGDDRDPFEVIGPIPKKLSYQWVTQAVWGEPEIAVHDYRIMVKGGWKPVPAKRHPAMPSEKGRIVFGGQILMQRPKALTDVALAGGYKSALDMVSSHRGYASPNWTAVEPKWDSNDAIKLYEERLDAVRIEAREAGHVYPAPFFLRVADNEVDAAATCGMTVTDYMRAKYSRFPENNYGTTVLMLKPVAITELGHPAYGKTVYEPVTLRIGDK